MKKISLFLIIYCCLIYPPLNSQDSLTIKDYAKSDQALSWNTSALGDRMNVRPTWHDDGSFRYPILGSDKKENIYYNPKTKTRKTFEKIEQAQVVIYLFDSTQFKVHSSEFKVELEKIKNKYPQKPLIVIANKIDQIDDSQIAIMQNEISEIQLLSAKTGFGVEQLTNKLLNLINTGALRNNETIITNSRHYDALIKAFEEVEKVKEGLESGLSGDLLAIDIRQALYHFGEITGEITNDDLLGNIFANFCIGK